LESKINYYQAIHDNTDLWISLDGGPIDGDSVFPMALEMLP
jgi:serine/threonine-protein kinase PpkA